MTEHRNVVPRRGPIRLAAAILAAAMAVMYYLIGFDVVRVVEGSAGGADGTAAAAPGLLAFGLIAGTAFALGAVLVLATDRRAVWLLGAAFQVGAILAYVAVAPQRTPPYEVWGVLLKVGQGLLLVALLTLLATAPRRARQAQPARAVAAARRASVKRRPR